MMSIRHASSMGSFASNLKSNLQFVTFWNVKYFSWTVVSEITYLLEFVFVYAVFIQNRYRSASWTVVSAHENFKNY